ncbi:MAG: hypothetical protein DCC51_07565 [Anaerolineae bacterium]|nr:MAG: hypothetical protein DCC51_07565 [Anaerolineae bacterium]
MSEGTVSTEDPSYDTRGQARIDSRQPQGLADAQVDPAGPGLPSGQHDSRRRRPRIPVWLRTPHGVFLLGVLLLGIAGTVPLAMEIGQPFGGYASTVFMSPLTSPGVIISEETPVWWPIYWEQPALENSSLILTIDGQPTRMLDSGAYFEQLAANGRKYVTLEIHHVREDRTSKIKVPVLRFKLTHFLEIKLPDLITGLSLWLMALVVLRARPQEPLNQVFAVAAATVAAQRWLEAHTLWLEFKPYEVLLEVLLMAVAGLVGPVLFHFSLLFPTRIRPWPRRLVIGVYILGGVNFVLLSLSRVPAVRRWPEPFQTNALNISDLSYRMALLIYLVAMLIMLWRLVWHIIDRRHSRRQRRIAGIVTLSLLVAAPMILTAADSIIPGMGENQIPFWLGLDLRYLFLAVPFALSFVIVRYQSMRSPSRLLVLVIAVAGSALLATLFSWLWSLTQENWPASGDHPPFPWMFVGIFLATAFWSTQAHWNGWFGRLLAWERHSYEATRAFGRRVSGVTHPRPLAQAIAEALVSELQLDRAAVWLWDAEQNALTMASQAGQQSPPLPDVLTPPSDQLPEANQPLRLDYPGVLTTWLGPLATLQAVDVVVPLESEERFIGLLGLGHRWDEEVFDDRDLVIAELIGQQTALFLLAAMQVEELRHVPQLIVDAQEQERLRLAGELHDTVQQFLGRLPFALDVDRDEILADPDGIVGSLSRCLTETEEMAETVRRIQFNLAPTRLEFSFLNSVEELVDQIQQRSGLNISLEAGKELDAATTLPTRWALYRVIQQALENSVRHAAAKQAAVRLSKVNGRVTLVVADDGRGCSEAERLTAQQNGRFGIMTMRVRLELAGGEFAFVSTPGEGTTVSGWVPAAAGLN